MDWTLLLGLTLPSAVVLLAVYLMFKQYFRHQVQVSLMQSRGNRDHISLPLKLQAYERLILLSERIDIAELVLRLRTQGTSAAELRASLLLAVQQEYEHNLTQQLYITEELWKVLILARNKTMDMISVAGGDHIQSMSAEEYVKALFALADQEPQLPSAIAKKAIKTESSLLL